MFDVALFACQAVRFKQEGVGCGSGCLLSDGFPRCGRRSGGLGSRFPCHGVRDSDSLRELSRAATLKSMAAKMINENNHVNSLPNPRFSTPDNARMIYRWGCAWSYKPERVCS